MKRKNYLKPDTTVVILDLVSSVLEFIEPDPSETQEFSNDSQLEFEDDVPIGIKNSLWDE